MQPLWSDQKLVVEFMRLTQACGTPQHAAKQLLPRVRDEYEALLAEVMARAAATNSWANALENQLQKVLAACQDGGAWEPVDAALPPAIDDDGYSGELEVRCIGWRGGKRGGWQVAQDEDGVAVTHWRFISYLAEEAGEEDG